MTHRSHIEERTRDVLDFERDWRSHEGRKNAAIRERFGITPARYYQLLNRAIDDPDALDHDPLTVRRLRRRRDERVRRRSARALGERAGR
jgi:hypothetical protein